MAIPGDPMCGLHVVKKGHGHKAIYNFVGFIEEAETRRVIDRLSSRVCQFN